MRSSEAVSTRSSDSDQRSNQFMMVFHMAAGRGSGEKLPTTPGRGPGDLDSLPPLPLSGSFVQGSLLVVLLALNPCADGAREHIQWDRTGTQDRVVESADVESFSQSRLGLFAQLLDLQLTDLVRQRLAGPGDVAVDF